LFDRDNPVIFKRKKSIHNFFSKLLQSLAEAKINLKSLGGHDKAAYNR